MEQLEGNGGDGGAEGFARRGRGGSHLSDVEMLPSGWCWVPAQDICVKIQSGSTPKGKPFTETGDIPFLKVYNIVNQKIAFSYKSQYVSREVHEKKLQRSITLPGDVLMNIVGPPLGKVAIVTEEYQAWNINQALVLFRPTDGLFNRYLYFYLLGGGIVRDVAHETKGIVGQVNISLTQCRENILPLPPLNEQRRIVAKIEELTAHSRRAREALDDVPGLINQFRQSVLAAAFRGDLTTDWREKNPNVEPAEELLERIRVERRQRWEKAELEKMRAKGKEPKNEKWKEKYKEPLPFEKDIPHVFPDTWSLSLIDTLLSVERAGMKTGPFGSLLKKSDHQTVGIPVLGIENISENGFIPGNKIFISPEKASELSEYCVLSGDVIISRSGTVGEVCVVPEGLGNARISTNLIRITLFAQGMLPEYFSYLFRGSSSVLSQIKKLCAGSTRDFLNQTILNKLIFPIPPLEEQRIIVEKIEYLFSIIEKLKEQWDATYRDCEFLDQSILAKAFRGELVPQDPSDEPASALLDRIRAEREKLDTTKKKGRTSRKKAKKT